MNAPDPTRPWHLTGPNSTSQLVAGWYPPPPAGTPSAGCRGGIDIIGGDPRRRVRQLRIQWWAKLSWTPAAVEKQRWTGIKRAPSIAAAVVAFELATGVDVPADIVAALEKHAAHLLAGNP